MGLALRIRVTWEGDVVEDRVHEGYGAIAVGAGERARVVAPGDPGKLVWFTRRGNRFRLHVTAGAAERVEFPGEDPIAGDLLVAPFDRILPVGSGRVVIGGADVDFEVLRTERDYAALYLGVGLAGVALVALMAGSFYKLARQWGDGQSARWGEPTQLGAEQARFLRVTMDPGAQGASKLAAGTGSSRHGVDSPLLVRDAKPVKRPASPPVASAAKVASRPKHTRPPKRPSNDVPAADGNIPTFVVVEKPSPPVDDDDDGDADDLEDSDDDDTAARADLVTAGQQALLAAELRSAIDSLTAAEKTDKLDYDNLNWLGLAHYFLGENEQAEARWNEALAIDATRPDAVNNLGGVAKRRGDTAGEIADYQKALELHPGDCHALNSMALALAKQGKLDDAARTLDASDSSCGGGYAYTFIQRAGILSLSGKRAEAMVELERGLAKVDTLIPIKEYEVEADLLLDPAFARLRSDPKFESLTAKYLPRAVKSRSAILSAHAAPKKMASANAPPSSSYDF